MLCLMRGRNTRSLRSVREDAEKYMDSILPFTTGESGPLVFHERGAFCGYADMQQAAEQFIEDRGLE